MVLFEGSPQSPRSYVRYIRHASSAEYRSMSYIRRKDPPPRFFPLSLFNSLTFLAPWAGDYSLRSGVDYSLRPGVVRTPRAYLFSPLKISPEAGGLRLVLPVETKCGHRKCHKRHCQQVCGASGRLSLWSGSHVFKVDSGLVGKLVTWDLLSP